MAVHNTSNPKEYYWQYSEAEKERYIGQHGQDLWDQFKEKCLDDVKIKKISEYAKNHNAIDHKEKMELIDLIREVHPEMTSEERVRLGGAITNGRYKHGYTP